MGTGLEEYIVEDPYLPYIMHGACKGDGLDEIAAYPIPLQSCLNRPLSFYVRTSVFIPELGDNRQTLHNLHIQFLTTFKALGKLLRPFSYPLQAVFCNSSPSG